MGVGTPLDREESPFGGPRKKKRPNRRAGNDESSRGTRRGRRNVKIGDAGGDALQNDDGHHGLPPCGGVSVWHAAMEDCTVEIGAGVRLGAPYQKDVRRLRDPTYATVLDEGGRVLSDLCPHPSMTTTGYHFVQQLILISGLSQGPMSFSVDFLCNSTLDLPWGRQPSVKFRIASNAIESYSVSEVH